jgi:hypothetical protein
MYSINSGEARQRKDFKSRHLIIQIMAEAWKLLNP